MNRRAFVIGASVFLAMPLAATAQPGGKVHRIGYLSPSNPSPLAEAFRERLRELGYVEGQNLKIEYRYAEGRVEHLPRLAGELVGLGVDVLVAWSPAGAIAAKRSTSQIPVVFLAAPDPVGFGLVSSLARPGGNVTGMSFDASPDLSGKKLQLLMEAVPGLARVALLAPASEPGTERDRWPMLAGQAKALNLEVREVEVQAPADLEAAVRRAKAQGAQALYVWPSNLARLAGRQLSDLALAHRLPSIHGFRESVVAGGLLSYAPSLTDIARHGAVYVDKILRGAMPNDLPVEQPTKFELVINLKTAKALGLRISPSLLLRADQVIE